MKFQTYTSTPGLERLPKRQRLAAWQAAHKQLLIENADYRKRFHSYLVMVVCLSCAMLPFYLPFFGFALFGVIANVAITLCLAALIVYLALRQMKFMNQSIALQLQSSRPPASVPRPKGY